MEIPLRLDANQGWDVNNAIKILKALEPFNIESCEEPIPRWDFMELRNVKDHTTIPIMADETCGDNHDAKRLIDLKACDTINIKLGKSSGIFNALKIIEIAEKHHMKLQVGGFLESRLAFTASAHLALASENIIYFDFDTPLMFTEDPVSGGIFYDKNGKVSITETPGLGAWMENDYLQTLKKVIIT
jgi:L-alanine-DL-glutamate epimerase-like enolase superfamily enzyme